MVKLNNTFAEVKDAASKKGSAVWALVFGLYAHYAQSGSAHERTGPGGSRGNSGTGIRRGHRRHPVN
jgi:hypothetical protein